MSDEVWETLFEEEDSDDDDDVFVEVDDDDDDDEEDDEEMLTCFFTFFRSLIFFAFTISTDAFSFLLERARFYFDTIVSHADSSASIH